MTHSQLDAMLRESGMDTDDLGSLSEVLGPLVELAHETPPPTAALLALFAELSSQPDTDPAPVPGVVTIRRGRGRAALAGAVVLALSGVGATGLSAAANTLPSPWQHQVSDFSRRYLPFDFPEPAVRIPRLSRTPHVRKDLGADGVRRDGDAEELTRSLVRGRAGTRGALAWIGRHAGRVHRDEDSRGDSPTSSHPRESGEADTPAPTTRSTAAPGAGPRAVGGGPTSAAAGPVRPLGSGQAQGIHRPHHAEGPDGGHHQISVPVVQPTQGVVAGPVAGDAAPVAGEPRGDEGTPAPDDDSTPREGGPALDKVTPDVGEPSAGDGP